MAAAAINDTKTVAKRAPKYPKSVIFIVANEFCERFSFYGMRTILTIYLHEQLHYDKDVSTVIYHAFTMMVYFFPIFGAIIADSWLGKFKTIFYLSIVYAIGNIVLALGAVPTFNIPHKLVTLIGLVLIAMGTGGIKPCVSSFGGDQFVLPQQERQLVRFFSLFYFAINAGSLISTFLTPILRNDVHCLGETSCYSLAFGVPGVLMIISLIIFLVGKPMYKIKKPAGNIILHVGSCICYAISQRSKRKHEVKKDHWLDYADNDYEPEFIEGIKTLLHVLVVFIPVPIFWALFDQQGSRWTFQAAQMKGDFGWFEIQPDQMQVLNPLLIIIFIPIFESIIYPLFNRLNIINKPLQRMTCGGFLAALAFVMSAYVEIQLKDTYAPLPTSGMSQVRIYNGFSCDVSFTNLQTTGEMLTVEPLKMHEFDLNLRGNMSFTMDFKSPCFGDGNSQVSINEQGQNSFFLHGANGALAVESFLDDVAKNDSGTVKLRILSNVLNKYPLVISDGNINPVNTTTDLNADEIFDLLPSNNYNLKIKDKVKKLTLKLGGVYALILDETSEGILKTSLVAVTPPNSLSILWLIPQYVTITAAEIMFSVTGLEFSYSQAPSSMKSVLSSIWLLTTSIGNLIVVVITEINFFKTPELQFLFYAVLMALVMVGFSFLAAGYKYVKKVENSSSETHDVKRGVDNVNFHEDEL